MQQARAARAYQAASARRGLRDQEADVFRRVNGGLRAARHGSPLDRVKAVADNGRLWMMVGDLLRDPENALPPGLRASIVSVAQAVQREMQGTEPDLGFLIAVNEDMAAGLSGQL